MKNNKDAQGNFTVFVEFFIIIVNILLTIILDTYIKSVFQSIGWCSGSHKYWVTYQKLICQSNKPIIWFAE